MYATWDEQALNSLTAIKWYTATELVEYLDSLRRFIIKTPGKISLNYIPKLENGEDQASHILPANKNQRFPEDQVYICEAIGEWGFKLDYLELITNVMVNTNRLQRNYANIRTPGDLEYRAIEVIHDLMNMAQNRVDFINRQRFEERYRMSWVIDSDQSSQEGTIAINNSSNLAIKREESSVSNVLEQPAVSGNITPTDNGPEPLYSADSSLSEHIIDLTHDNLN